MAAAIPLILPQEYAVDVYLFGEARGGGFALSEIPHPNRGLYLDAKIRIDFYSTKRTTYFGCSLQAYPPTHDFVIPGLTGNLFTAIYLLVLK